VTFGSAALRSARGDRDASAALSVRAKGVDRSAGTVAFVVDVDLLPQSGRVVLAVLQDGRQLEGELLSMSDRFVIGGTAFDAWQIEELDHVT
jgi:hypothetical protein